MANHKRGKPTNAKHGRLKCKSWGTRGFVPRSERDGPPSNDVLLRLAEMYPPPQSWWDDDMNPFESGNGQANL